MSPVFYQLDLLLNINGNLGNKKLLSTYIVSFDNKAQNKACLNYHICFTKFNNIQWNFVIYVDLIYCKFHFIDLVSDLNTTDIVSMKVFLFHF